MPMHEPKIRRVKGIMKVVCVVAGTVAVAVPGIAADQKNQQSGNQGIAHVRVEASDMGTVTTIEQLPAGAGFGSTSGEVRDRRQP